MSKVIVGMCITIIVKVITIWDELFFKIIVSFGGMVIMKMVLLESSHHIETHLDVVVEVIGVQSSVNF